MVKVTDLVTVYGVGDRLVDERTMRMTKWNGRVIERRKRRRLRAEERENDA